MSAAATIGLGGVGGLLGWIVIFALPEVRSMLQQEDFRPPTLGRLLLMVTYAVLFIIVGAVAAPIFGAGEAKEAILYGLAGEGLFAGAVKTATT